MSTADAGRAPAHTLSPAPRRRPTPSVTVVAVLTAIVLLVLAAAAGQEALAAWNAVPGQGWLSTVLDAMTRMTGPQLRAVAAGLLAISLAVLLVAVLPHRRREAPLPTAPALFVEPLDLARLSSAAASRVDGVLRASSSATVGAVVVSVEGTGSAATTREVEAVVTEHLRPLGVPVRLRVRTRNSVREADPTPSAATPSAHPLPADKPSNREPSPDEHEVH